MATDLLLMKKSNKFKKLWEPCGLCLTLSDATVTTACANPSSGKGKLSR